MVVEKAFTNPSTQETSGYWKGPALCWFPEPHFLPSTKVRGIREEYSMKFGEKRGLGYYPRILVTGDTGFFGTNLKPILESKYPRADLIYSQGTKFFDLTQQGHASTMFRSISVNHGAIQVVINLAALSGGMFSNMENQASYWYNNTLLITNIIEQCAVHKVRKLLLPIGGCSYPDTSSDGSGVFKEEDLWTGFPNQNSYGYSMAKKQAVVAAKAYFEQFGLITNVLIPTNPIGPWDNCSDQDSHVPMALIKRFVEAKESGAEKVTVYGSGRPERDFIYIEDIVKLFPDFIQYYNSVEPMNISTGKGTSIAELAETIARVVKYDGNIHFDRTKADGQAKKILDNTKLLNFIRDNNIEWEITPLEEAISLTVDWYRRRVQEIPKYDDAVG